MGVDPNRNWPIDWSKSSKDPCHETFRGPSEGSEPEVRGLMNSLQEIKNKQGLKLYIDWHSYSQLVIYRELIPPSGYIGAWTNLATCSMGIYL